MVSKDVDIEFRWKTYKSNTTSNDHAECGAGNSVDAGGTGGVCDWAVGGGRWDDSAG
jgi:hypothetical protein